MFCHVAPGQVLGIHDVKSVYHVPLMLEAQGIVEYLGDRLGLGLERNGDRKDSASAGAVAVAGGLGLRIQYIEIGEEARLKGRDLKARWKELTSR